jgi:hypothetical protein
LIFVCLQANATDAQNWWMQTSLYCCGCKYPDLVTTAGSAFGWQTYLEMGAALVVLTVYLLSNKTGKA